MDTDKIKNLFKKYKWYYIIGGSLVFAGVTGLILRGRYAGMLRVPDGSDVITVRPLSFNFGGNNNGNAVVVIHSGDVGHPGFLTYCKETDQVFTSQKSAAKTLDISPSILSSHLNGKIENANGLHFERIGAPN